MFNNICIYDIITINEKRSHNLGREQGEVYERV